jgi:superfamily II DNA/RNA helicase
MSVYSWEASGSGSQHRKKAKKTGTVVLHTDEHVDTAFERLQREVTVERLHASQKEAEAALANPHANTVKTALMTPETAKALRGRCGFTSLLPCQAQCYRGIFNGRDVILHSRTGSGKTLAYALPIIERHLLLEQHATDAPAGPFLLIFVFSNDLAMQTRSVLTKIYGAQSQLRIAVAGFDDLQPTPTTATTTTAEEEEAEEGYGDGKPSKRTSLHRSNFNGGAVDILIGTVRTIDEAIRGHKLAAAATAAEEAEKEREARLLGQKRPRSSSAAAAVDDSAARKRDDDDAEEDGVPDDDETGSVATREAGVIVPARVRAIVVDEVDLTLGPRFSALGRRMKNLLKFVRRANGALSDGLLNDFRAHHYVLCGATIPNWVLKAGFLGVKKYYYQLVTVGTAKLPSRLECFHQRCRVADRVAVALRLLTRNVGWNGRVVVFGSVKQLAALEAGLASSASTAVTGEAGDRSSKNKKKSSSPVLVVRALTSEKDEVERVAAIEDFNSGVAQVLLCSDVAARGLDFVGVDTVLMLNLPHHTLAAETFVHRAGRTARVGRPGRCIQLHDTTEDATLDAVAKATHVVMKALPPAVVVSLAGTKSPPTTSTTSASSPSSPSATSAETTIAMRLVVRNPFRHTKPQVKVPSAMQVLTTNVTEPLRGHLTDVCEEEGSNGEVVTFRVPAGRLHEVKQQLWKYSLQEA